LSKYHSTMNRREFMKVLGLGGAGLAASAVAPPVFKDLDEAIASPQALWQRPSWVKEVAKPTVEVDWQTLKRFDYREVMFVNGFTKAMGKDFVAQAAATGSANTANWLKNKRPGFTLKDYALKMATQSYAFDPHSFLGYKKAPTPETLGVPRYEGTPEENARMVRSVMRVLGAVDVGFVEVETDTTEKLFYAFDADSKRLDIKDVPVAQAEDAQDYRVLPKSARWVIVYTMKMAYEMVHRLPSFCAEATVYMPYAQGPWLQDRFQEFVRTLGYTCFGEPRPNSLGTSVGFGVMAGLGEISRIEHIITPERGFSQRVFKMVTDLPLAPTSPVDTGVMDFCRVCKKCAEQCPTLAISTATEPGWEIPGPYKNPGVKGWFRTEPRCYTYWRQTGTGCGFCLALCPLNKPPTTSYFNAMRSTIATTKQMNRTFRKMDDVLNNGARENLGNFWDLEIPPMGLP
jgi:epoxyqueuosine reductase